jgi:hypothetical protein
MDPFQFWTQWSFTLNKGCYWFGGIITLPVPNQEAGGIITIPVPKQEAKW